MRMARLCLLHTFAGVSVDSCKLCINVGCDPCTYHSGVSGKFRFPNNIKRTNNKEILQNDPAAPVLLPSA